MLKKIIPYCWLVLILFLTSCEGDLFHECLSGRGNPTTVKRGLYPFGNIAVYDNINLTIEQGDQFSITLTDGEKLIPMISSLIKNNTLEIRNESPCSLLKDPWKPVEVVVSLPVLDSLFIRTQGKIRVNGALKQQLLYVMAYETAADVQLNLQTRYFRLDNLKGAADIYLSGYSDTVFIYNIATGRSDALGIETEVMSVNTGSMNDTYVRAGKKLLDVKIDNIGNVFYRNNPELINFYSTSEGKLLLYY